MTISAAVFGSEDFGHEKEKVNKIEAQCNKFVNTLK
jgi:hypothetical protein